MALLESSSRLFTTANVDTVFPVRADAILLGG
jgi:hypothetical protein